MKDFERGAKRKCSSCSILFFDFNKFPIKCPKCGADVISLLTNVSKRGRPPKNPKVEVPKPSYWSFFIQPSTLCIFTGS